MSYKAQDWAWYLDIHKGTAKTVLLCLAFHANPKDDPVIAWPSTATIARRTGYDRKTIFEALRWLKRHGLIAPHGFHGRAIAYTLACYPDGKRRSLSRPVNGTAAVPFSVLDDPHPALLHPIPKAGR